jgi:solute:Na+ symporter, SSS family
MKLTLASADILVIAAYFAAVFLLAWWVTRRREDLTSTPAGYFLAGRNVGWFVVGASLFASNIGSEHLIGLAGTGFSSGVAVGQFEVLASLILLLLGWVFVPFYIRSGVFTMPEFLERRYSPGARAYLSWISILGYVLTKISVTIAAAGIVFEAMGVGFWTGAFVVVIATGLYTVLGGLRAVVYTDLLQMFVLIAGSVTVTALGLAEIGGWDALRSGVEPGFMSLWKPMSDPDFPWTGILFGAPILGVWYWCTDQFIVQRVLSAKDEENARRGTIFGGFLKVLPLFIFVIPGLIAFSLSQQGRLSITDGDQALPALIGLLLPAGLRGLVIAGLLAALMSSLSSVFNSCSTLITLDIYGKLRPDATPRRLVTVGRVATALLVLFGLAWIPVMRGLGQIYVYLQSVQAYISPPIAAVFLLGIFWKRLNARGAMAALMSGLVLGMSKLALEVRADSLSGFWHGYATFNFLHFAALLFVVCATVLVLVSFTAPAPSAAQLKDLTFGTVTDRRAGDPRRRRQDLLWSLLLVALVAVVWIYFRP